MSERNEAGYLENSLFALQRQFEISFLPRIDLENRFGIDKRHGLAHFMSEFWRERLPMAKDAAEIGWTPEGVGIGSLSAVERYNNGEFRACVSPDRECYPSIYYCANLPFLEQMVIAQSDAEGLRRKGAGRLTLVVPFLGFQRGERPVKRKVLVEKDGVAESEKREDLEVFRTAISNLLKPFDSLITLDTHSPGTAFFCIENGVPILELTAMPLLLAKARHEGLITADEELAVVVGDDGASEMGKMIQYLLGWDKVPFLQGEKIKEGDKKRVIFTEEELQSVKGKTVIIAEDMIDSGGTMLATVKELKNAGAKKIVILATHAIFSKGVEKLIKEENIHIIVSNSRRNENDLPDYVKKALTDIERENGLYFVDIFEPLKRVIDLDRQNGLRTAFEDNWERLLVETGLCLAPWQIGQFTKKQGER